MFGRIALNTIKQTTVTPVFGQFFAIIGSSVAQNHTLNQFNIWQERRIANAIEPKPAPESTKIVPQKNKS